MPHVSHDDVVIYINNEKAIIAFRGTASVQDVLNDIQLSHKGNSCNFEKVSPSLKYVQMFLDNTPEETLVQCTGHSLGGAVARCVGSGLKLGVVTFNSAAPPTSPVINGTNQVHYHIVFDVISAWQSPCIRIDKGFRPNEMKYLGPYISKFFHTTSLKRLEKAHELMNFSNEKLGTTVDGLLEDELWSIWLNKLPGLMRRIFLKFVGVDVLPPVE